MKRNRKLAVLGFITAASLLLLSACGKAETAAEEIDPSIQSQLEQVAPSLVYEFASLSSAGEQELAEIKKSLASSEDYAGLSEGLNSWLNVSGELGALVAVGEDVKTERIDHGYMATVHAEFEKRNLEFSVAMDSQVQKIVSVSLAPEYTVAEKMVKASLNTLMGMGTVFLVLIFISFLISGFKFINAAEAKMKQKGPKEEQTSSAPTPQASALQKAEDLSGNLELAAVIAAAIAAAEGTSPSGLVVRSIKRAQTGTWKRA